MTHYNQVHAKKLTFARKHGDRGMATMAACWRFAAMSIYAHNQHHARRSEVPSRRLSRNRDLRYADMLGSWEWRDMRDLANLHELAALASLTLFIGTLLLIVGMVGH